MKASVVAAEQLLVRRLARGATPVRDEEWRALLRSIAAGRIHPH
jgi:hypothetical protein